MLDEDGKLLFGRDVTLSCYACHYQMCYVYVFYLYCISDLCLAIAVSLYYKYRI